MRVRMDFQKIVDAFETMTCVLSVEQYADGSYGNIRIVAANKAYVDSIENTQTMSASVMLQNHFVPGDPYERYVPKNSNFEENCYQCAIKKQPIHSYVHPDYFPFWIDFYMLPLQYDQPGIRYCTYSQELTKEADAGRMSNLSFETASDVLQTCIKLRRMKDFQAAMDEVTEDIRHICKANRCRILLLDMQKRSYSLLCEAYAHEGQAGAMENYMGEGFYDIVATWKDAIGRDSYLILKNKDDMKRICIHNQKWYDHLIKAGVESMVLFPLQTSEKMLGYMWVTNFNTANVIRIKETLELATFFIASEIANHQLLDRLHNLSSVDVLTGVKNRNAMNIRIDQYLSGQENNIVSLGIIFADLNGLKRINDNEGHAAGDRLLKNAASLLRELFGEEGLYRAGGDEFMIIIKNVSKEKLEECVDRIRVCSESAGDISFAIGSCYDDKECDIRKAMQIADERMYQDKEEYYRRHPWLERRKAGVKSDS